MGKQEVVDHSRISAVGSFLGRGLQRGERVVHQINLADVLFHGAVTLERVGEGIKPWRLPYTELTLFAPPLVKQAANPAGVRIGFMSSTETVEVTFEPDEADRQVDCVIDDELVETAVLPAGEESIRFTGLSPAHKRIELFLSQKADMVVKGVAIDEGATRELLADDRPRWITYGSSITKAAAAASPAQTWPAIVARRNRLNLTCLGYSAQCHIEPMVARMIRDLPADFISLCLGINVMGGSSLGPRTFRWAVVGMIKIIREKHPNIPMVVQSPIFSPDRETNDNLVGLNLVKMRDEIQEAVASLQALGDKNLHYLDGLRILGPEHADRLPDNLHPDAEGYRIMAENFDRIVMQEMGIAKALRP